MQCGVFFFFQAEDGIRDYKVTGVQTCALPIYVYHFGAYEPGALKRLMGMYGTREDEIDRLLRAGALVDLHQAYKQGMRASVEEYSLKKVEAFYGFERKTLLETSRGAMRYVEHRL